jgi:hypothetical protein
MIRSTLFAAILTSLFLAQAHGQAPTLIRIIRNAPASDADPIQPYVNASTQVNVVGARAVTGSAESWLIEAHDSFASIETTLNALARAQGVQAAASFDALPLSGTTIGLFRGGLSYRAEEAMAALQRSRYLNVSVYRVRAGGDLEFAELIRIRRRGLDAINMDRPELAYQILSGAPSGTYVFLSPLATLKTLDNGIARLPVYAEAMAEAGADAGRKLAAQAELAREQRLFRLDPRISYVSDEFAAADVDFWRGK